MTSATPDREIERRFLVDLDVARQLTKKLPSRLIEQAYLPGSGDWQIRSRQTKHRNKTSYLLTMKRHVSHGICDEIQLTSDEATHLNFLAVNKVVLAKNRTYHDLDCRSVLELDVYCDEALIPGYAIAEVEVESLDDPIVLPNWVGREITGEKEFSNHALFMKLISRLFGEEKC